MDCSTNEIRIVPPLPSGQEVLTEVLRQGAQKMLGQAVEAEVADWLERHQQCRDEPNTGGSPAGERTWLHHQSP